MGRVSGRDIGDKAGDRHRGIGEATDQSGPSCQRWQIRGRDVHADFVAQTSL